MRTVSGDELTVLNSQHPNVYAKLEIKNAAGTWVDYTSFAGKDYFVGIRLSTDVDSPVWSMQATLKRDGEVSTESLSPLRGDSTLNSGGPAINAAREWRVSVAVVANGAGIISGDWKELCAGYIDKPDFTSDPMGVEGRSVGVRLMDSTIRVKRTYNGTFEDVAQQIVTDNLPTPVPTLYIPSPPAFTVTEYTPYQVSVMDALVTLALSTGWMVRDVYDPADSTMKTAIIDPQRAKSTADATLTASTYSTVDQASLDTANIRNVIEGEFIDGVTGEVLTIGPVIDTDSVAAFGGIERYMKFSEGEGSPINSGNEMLDMINAALADLALPKFDHTVTSTLFWPAEITDLIEFTGNAVHYDTTQTLALLGIVHDLTQPGHGTTQFACRGAPAGAYLEWIRRQGNGITGPQIPPATVLNWLVAEGTQYGGTSATVDGALWLGYTLPPGVDEMRIHVLLGDGPNLGVPSIIDPTTWAVTIRRPEGDIGKSASYGSIAILSTDENYYKRIAMYSVRGGLTSQPVIAPTTGAMQAVDPVPTPADGTVASLSVVRDGSTNTVTVTPGTLEPTLGFNYVCIIRNKHILPPIPIGTSTAPVVFVDSGLDPSAAATYAYEAFIGNFQQGANGWFVSGGKRLTVVEAPTLEPPLFANGTPIATVVGFVPEVQIDWTGATAGASGVRVEASIDGVTVRTVGTGALASGTVYDPVTGPKLYRLVATSLIPLGDVVAGPWTWYTGLNNPLSNPGTSPSFTNGTPKIVFGSTFPTPTLKLGFEWADPVSSTLAPQLVIQRSTTGTGGPWVDLLVTAASASGSWQDPDSANVGIEAWYRIIVRQLPGLGGATVATSAVTHYVPQT